MISHLTVCRDLSDQWLSLTDLWKKDSYWLQASFSFIFTHVLPSMHLNLPYHHSRVNADVFSLLLVMLYKGILSEYILKYQISKYVSFVKYAQRSKDSLHNHYLWRLLLKFHWLNQQLLHDPLCCWISVLCFWRYVNKKVLTSCCYLLYQLYLSCLNLAIVVTFNQLLEIEQLCSNS